MSTLAPLIRAEAQSVSSPPRSMRKLAARVWLAGCLFAAVATGLWGYVSPSVVMTKPRIDQMTVGRWVLAGNPSGERDTEFGTEVDPATWRMLHLEAPKADGSVADVWMLRPLWWLEENEAVVHGEVLISVPECGIDGMARVLLIGECPQVSPRPGPEFQLVTATFRHHHARVIDVQVEGLSEPIGTTPNHPFWSEDEQDFVRADELSVGDHLRQADGSLTCVVSLNPRAGTHDVFNLEVQVDHTYHVGASGVLVHNTAPRFPGLDAEFWDDNYLYRLVNGDGGTVYYGIAEGRKNLARRLAEHSVEKAGEFVRMEVLLQGLSRKQAKNVETWAMDNMKAPLNDLRSAKRVNNLDAVSTAKRFNGVLSSACPR